MKMFASRSKQNSENETKFVQDRIHLAERNVAEMTIAFSSYSRKAAKLRDSGDELTTTLQQYANSETVNQSLSSGLNNCAGALITINDYSDKRVQYIDGKVVAQLAPYETICKNMKESVKNIFVTKDKESLRQRQLDRIKERNPRNRQQIVEAESELVHAKAEVSRTVHNLEDKLISFERQKLHDLKEILLDFVCTEIGYHSKAISLLTEAYTNINGINIDNDLEDLQKVFDDLDPKFKSTLRNPNNVANETATLSRNTQSLGTLNTAGRTGIPHQSQTKRQSIIKSMRKKAQSEDILNQEDYKEQEDSHSASESDFTDSDTDEHPPNPVKVKGKQRNFAARQYLH